jgi:hypothetical protein
MVVGDETVTWLMSSQRVPSGLRWEHRPIFERGRQKSKDFKDLFAEERKDLEALKR